MCPRRPITAWSTPSRANSKTVTPWRRRLNEPPERTIARRRAADPFSAMTSRRTVLYADSDLKGDGVPSFREFGDERVRLDLHEDFGRDKPGDLDHRRRGTDGAEHFAVGASDALPVVDVLHVHPRAHDVG